MAETDPQIARIMPIAEVTAQARQPGRPYRDVIAAILTGYRSRAALGSREYDVERNAVTGRAERVYRPTFTMHSYDALREQIEAIASAWQNDDRFRVAPREAVIFVAFTSVETTITDLACAYATAIVVPLGTASAAEDMSQVIDDVSPVCIVSTIDSLDQSIALAIRQDTVRSVVVIDFDDAVDDDREKMSRARAAMQSVDGRLALCTFGELLEIGREATWQPSPALPGGTDEIALIMFTSGSTGTPKGALIHEKILIQFWADIADPVPAIGLAYGPMNHFVGRIQIYHSFAQGGTAYFTAKSDMSTLLDDVRIARPTTLTFFPRLVEMTYQHYLSEVQRRVGAGGNPDEVDRQVREEMRASYLGDRLVSGVTGSSPTSLESRQFIRDCFQIDLVDIYGTTEAGGCALIKDSHIQHDHIIDYKLRDVPELGYYTTDKPHPRGEFLVKTDLQIRGYLNRPDADAAVFLDGYVVTGDIMAKTGSDSLVWLDRRNNVIKLSQGEFVALSSLEARYASGDPLIKQIHVYGDSLQSFLLAVVVPDLAIAEGELGHAPTDHQLRDLVLARLQAVGRAAELKSFEVPRDVLIERELFSFENGLMSSVRKLLRPKLKDRYAAQLEKLYADIDRRQKEDLLRLTGAGSGLTTLERITGALKVNLGLDSVPSDGLQTYRDLGGDSLGSVALALLLEEMFEVKIPAGMILNPAGHIGQLADFIDGALAAGQTSTKFAEIHGSDALEVAAADLTLDRFIDTASLEGAANLTPARERVATVLLTGATGFLGRFLCLRWMEQLAANGGGKVICLVRARSSEDARSRVENSIGAHDADLKRRFDDLARDHLEVVAGDFGAPLLGLDPASYARLAEEVDLILHAGALVNHVLSYRELFEPNVTGNAELIRLALTDRRKHFDYISSVSVLYLSKSLAQAGEGADVRHEAAVMPLSDIYANGYGVSKWGGEVLLREAHQHYGLSVNVFRPDMIICSSGDRGEVNPADLLTRLIYSVLVTGLAPESFYEPSPDGERARTHYDALPVDFLSAAIVQIGAERTQRYSTYNSVNLNRSDGISLDTIIDWIASAGHRIERVADHGEWFRRFVQALQALPAEQRHHSVLDLTGHFAVPLPATEAGMPADLFGEAVKQVAAGPEVPHITERLIHKYIDDMHALAIL